MSRQAVTYPLFQITKKGPRHNKSVTLPIGLAACSAGTAFMEGTAPADQDGSCVVALHTGTKLFAGFITRDVLAAIAGVPAVPTPTFAELSGGNIGFETAFSAGLEGTIEDAEEYEAEGAAFVSSGNGARDISALTALGTKLSFTGGVTCVAQTGDRAEFELAEIETPSVSTNVRIRARKIYGVTV